MSALVQGLGGATLHGRRFGEKSSYPIPIWNGVFEHFCRIGAALWEFAWCIDKITEERDGIGIVLGGAPVKLETIASRVGSKPAMRGRLKTGHMKWPRT